eukprot:s533_g23.t1
MQKPRTVFVHTSSQALTAHIFTIGSPSHKRLQSRPANGLYLQSPKLLERNDRCYFLTSYNIKRTISLVVSLHRDVNIQKTTLFLKLGLLLQYISPFVQLPSLDLHHISLQFLAFGALRCFHPH